MLVSKEVEYKYLLAASDFESLMKRVERRSWPIRKCQTNYYFDTLGFDLSNNSQTLRLRTQGDRFRLTLKQKTRRDAYVEAVESSWELQDSEAFDLLSFGRWPPQVAEVIAALQTNEELRCLGTLTTWRTEFQLEVGKLSLDQNFYFHIQDFEVECEVMTGHSSVEVLLKDLFTGLTTMEPSANKGKYKRFLTSLIRLE